MSFFGIGALAIGATASTAFGVAAVGIAAETAVYGAISSRNASRGAAAVDRASGVLNQRYDQALAQQLDLDTQENIRTMRQEEGGYLSRQHVAYATAGVLANTGSALMTQIVNAGRFEKQVQQRWNESTRQQEQYYSEGIAGRLSGEARAVSDTKAGTLALINGGAHLAGLAFSSYRSGVFSGGGSHGGDGGIEND